MACVKMFLKNSRKLNDHKKDYLILCQSIYLLPGVPKNRTAFEIIQFDFYYGVKHY